MGLRASTAKFMCLRLVHPQFCGGCDEMIECSRQEDVDSLMTQSLQALKNQQLDALWVLERIKCYIHSLPYMYEKKKPIQKTKQWGKQKNKLT